MIIFWFIVLLVVNINITLIKQPNVLSLKIKVFYILLIGIDNKTEKKRITLMKLLTDVTKI